MFPGMRTGVGSRIVGLALILLSSMNGGSFPRSTVYEEMERTADRSTYDGCTPFVCNSATDRNGNGKLDFPDEVDGLNDKVNLNGTVHVCLKVSDKIIGTEASYLLFRRDTRSLMDARNFEVTKVGQYFVAKYPAGTFNEGNFTALWKFPRTKSAIVFAFGPKLKHISGENNNPYK